MSPAPTPVSPWITVLPEYNRAASVTFFLFTPSSLEVQGHVLPSALDMVSDMEVNMVADKEVHKMMNKVTKNVKDIVGEEN